MKLYVSTIIALGLMLNINSAAQAQETTTQVETPAATTDTTTTTTTNPPPGGQQVERIEVIGSRIKRINKEGANPVKNVGKDSMKNSANTTASDSLRDSTVATYGAAREQSGSNAAATATIGLRGFGATRTLVLLNGHRLPKDPAAEAVDLNLIPQGAIERIEVLKDGASALYGSDALGGVINIVTKKGFSGNEASVKYSGVEKPGGGAFDVSLLSGTSGEKLDFMAALRYNHSDKIFGKDREITKNGLSSIGATGAYQNGGAPWLLVPGCPPDLIRTNSQGSRCYFRYNEIATTRPQIGQLNLLTDLTYRMDSGIKIYNRNLVVHKDIEWSYAPTPVQLATPAGTASQPGATQLAYRMMEAGNRDNKDTELNYSALVGLKGNLTSIWEYDISTGYSEVNRKNKGVNGYIDGDVLDTIIANGTFDPLAAGNKGDISSAITEVFQDAKSKLFTIDAIFTGELGEMEAGPIGIATGASVFNEKLDQKTDDKSAAGIVYGSSGSNDKANRDVQSAFAEVSFPLTANLELDGAARVDHYSDFGTTANPKLSLKYTISPSVLVRTSVGTGFKAPTLSELYGASSDGFITFIDRKMCAVDTSYCTASQYHVIGGGNKDLKEEKAIAASLGTVVQATSSFSFSIDAWYTKVSNIVGINFEDLTQAELSGVNPADHGVTVVRDPGTGEIVDVLAPNLNLQEEQISGVDLNFEIGLSDSFLGHQLVLDNDFSYIIFDKIEGFPGAGERDVVGEWGMPKWRNSASLTMRNDISTYTLTMRSIPGQGYNDRLVDKKVSDLNEFDISAAYKISSVSQVTAGIKNLMDAAQPADSFGGTGGAAVVNTDLYDYNGRKFFVGYTQKF